MAISTCASIENTFLSITVDELGRIVSLVNKASKTELIDYPDAAEAWRLIISTGRSTIAKVYGSQQMPKIDTVRDADGETIILSYAAVQTEVGELAIRAKFILSLPAGSQELSARVEIDNRSGRVIDEVEFPIIGGLGGFRAGKEKRLLNLVAGNEHGAFYPDVLTNGLPDTGMESNHYVRELETAMFTSLHAFYYGHPMTHHGVWVDLWSERQGLYAGFSRPTTDLFAFKLEKSPKEWIFARPRTAAYPAGTPRWIRLFGLHMPKIQPDMSWHSEPVTIMPHTGDWHAGADRYGADRRAGLTFCEPPAWMHDFVGWTEILGWTYLGEVFHNYRHCAEMVVQDAAVTGLNFVFYYGHATNGAEAADYHNGPTEKLGGAEAFREMVETLHRHGIRIMLLDHVHRFVNRNLPEFTQHHLERYAIKFKDGRLASEQIWWKETGLSCLYLDGPTPEWVEMCPYCEEWQAHYLHHITRMVELGVDGLELDVFQGRHCYNPEHDHAPGTCPVKGKLHFMQRAREHARRLNPDFVLIGENMTPETRQVLDGWYPYRYPDETGRIFRYIFPELTQQAVLAGNYEYDQVNKALQFVLGVETEVDGLRKTAAEACPEMAAYIGEVNRLKRRYPELLMHGRFRDTVGATVTGGVYYSIIEGPGAQRALVLRNPTKAPQKMRATFAEKSAGEAILWRPFTKETRITLPAQLTLKPYEAAVVLQL